jgi:hypothetical protein
MAKTKTIGELRKLKKKWKRGIRKAVTERLKKGKVVALCPNVEFENGDISILGIDIVSKSSFNLNERMFRMDIFNEQAKYHGLGMSVIEYSVEELPVLIESAFSTQVKRRRNLNFASPAVLVLACMIDLGRYPKGGKSVNLLAAEFSRIFYEDSSHYGRRAPAATCALIRTGLRDLLKSGIAVRGMSGAYFFKPDLREIMNDQGISFLPLYQGKTNV